MVLYKILSAGQQADGEYHVRLAGTAEEVTLTKAAKTEAEIKLNDPIAPVAIKVDENCNADYKSLYQDVFNADQTCSYAETADAIYNAVVASAGVTLEDSSEVLLSRDDMANRGLFSLPLH